MSSITVQQDRQRSMRDTAFIRERIELKRREDDAALRRLASHSTDLPLRRAFVAMLAALPQGSANKVAAWLHAEADVLDKCLRFEQRDAVRELADLFPSAISAPPRETGSEYRA